MTKRSHEESHGSGDKKSKNGRGYDNGKAYNNSKGYDNGKVYDKSHENQRKYSQPQHSQGHVRNDTDLAKYDIDQSATSLRRNYTADHESAFKQLPPSTGHKVHVPGYTPFTVPATLPPLPPITDPTLADSPFTHKSLHGYDRVSTATDITYERLEFLGDAYLELFASRLIFHHFPALPAGSQSQVRELLVKNETLAEYAKLYGFEQKVKVADLERMIQESAGRGNKGLNKILGDVFEAYIAALVLSDPEYGFARAETWLTALWAPKLVEAARSHNYANPNLALHSSPSSDPRTTYSPTAKADLQRRIMGFDTKISYEPYQKMVELKGDQLGQNRHFIAVYLTGYGHGRKLLGKGEGKNKAEAGNWAALEAMFGECKETVDDCERLLGVVKEKRRREKEEREALMAKEENGA